MQRERSELQNLLRHATPGPVIPVLEKAAELWHSGVQDSLQKREFTLFKSGDSHGSK
jgi:hypothetical protein